MREFYIFHSMSSIHYNGNVSEPFILHKQGSCLRFNIVNCSILLCNIKNFVCTLGGLEKELERAIEILLYKHPFLYRMSI